MGFVLFDQVSHIYVDNVTDYTPTFFAQSLTCRTLLHVLFLLQRHKNKTLKSLGKSWDLNGNRTQHFKPHWQYSGEVLFFIPAWNIQNSSSLNGIFQTLKCLWILVSLTTGNVSVSWMNICLFLARLSAHSVWWCLSGCLAFSLKSPHLNKVTCSSKSTKLWQEQR